MKTQTRLYTAARLLENLIKSHCGEEATKELAVTETDTVAIVWPSGPFEWAAALTGGSHILAGELSSFGMDNPWYAAVLDIQDRYGVYFECYNDYTITVWEA